MTSCLEGVHGIISDLDGVVYRGSVALTGAVDALNELARRMPVIYATNNASRTPEDVAHHLAEMGLRTAEAQVVTSAMAGAKVLVDALKAAGRDGDILAVGGAGVEHAIRRLGWSAVRTSNHAAPPVGVLQGYGRETPWSAFAEASYAIQRGALWCLTNGDRTIPTARGIAPGNGMGGAAVAAATGVTPLRAGKPDTPIYEMALDRAAVPPASALALGDRLDTDIAGARRAGMTSVFVLTGVHDVPDVAAAAVEQRPTFVLPDLSTIFDPYVEAECARDEARCGAAAARWTGSGFSIAGGSPIERVRAVVSLGWGLLDDGRVGADELRRSTPTWAAFRDGGGDDRAQS